MIRPSERSIGELNVRKRLSNPETTDSQNQDEETIQRKIGEQIVRASKLVLGKPNKRIPLSKEDVQFHTLWARVGDVDIAEDLTSHLSLVGHYKSKPVRSDELVSVRILMRAANIAGDIHGFIDDIVRLDATNNTISYYGDRNPDPEMSGELVLPGTVEWREVDALLDQLSTAKFVYPA